MSEADEINNLAKKITATLGDIIYEKTNKMSKNFKGNQVALRFAVYTDIAFRASAIAANILLVNGKSKEHITESMVENAVEACNYAFQKEDKEKLN